MMDNKWLGSKTGQGFYKKEKKEDGSSEIKSLDLDKMEFHDRKSAKFSVLEQTKTIDKLSDRYKVLIKDEGKAGKFYRKNFSALFAYASNRIPESSRTVTWWQQIETKTGITELWMTLKWFLWNWSPLNVAVATRLASYFTCFKMPLLGQ